MLLSISFVEIQTDRWLLFGNGCHFKLLSILSKWWLLLSVLATLRKDFSFARQCCLLGRRTLHAIFHFVHVRRFHSHCLAVYWWLYQFWGHFQCSLISFNFKKLILVIHRRMRFHLYLGRIRGHLWRQDMQYFRSLLRLKLLFGLSSGHGRCIGSLLLLQHGRFLFWTLSFLLELQLHVGYRLLIWSWPRHLLWAGWF